MNDIGWHDKRSMSSKQLSSAPPTQPRRSCENTLRASHYQQMNIRLNSQAATERAVTSSYRQYPTVPSRSNYSHEDFPYPSHLHGVNRRPSPTLITSSSVLHAPQNRPLDVGNQSYRPQPRNLSRSASDDYSLTRYQELNNFNGETYRRSQSNVDNDDDDDQCSEIFNYTFHDAGVSYD